MIERIVEYSVRNPLVIHDVGEVFQGSGFAAFAQALEGGAVVRAYESAGRTAHATLRALGREWEADFGPNEIKTFHLGDDGVREVNLLEW